MFKCDIWNNLSYEDKTKLVKCIKHPFTTNHNTDECGEEIRPCRWCSKTTHASLLCNVKKSKSNKTFCQTLATSSTGDEVLLKSFIVAGKSANEKIGVLEDNCSTENYITYAKAREMNLKGDDIVLEVEGINTTKRINSKSFKVPIRDKRNNLHHIECYGLEKISSNQRDLAEDKPYIDLCKSFNVTPEEVRRPVQIDILLSAKSNYLMSDNVVKNINGTKLYSGPLGKTFMGSFKGNSVIKSYPSKATPVISTVKKAIIRPLDNKEILDFFKEESIGAECSPKCGNCECGKCPLGTKPMSLKEEKEYNKFRDNMFLDEKGTKEDPGPYWRTKYPWNVPKQDLIDNYPAVLGVMSSTAKKLDKDPEWRNMYENQLKDLIENKVAREISEEELDAWSKAGNKCYYTAHQMVLNPSNKSTPIRVVFNSSQKYKGYSLNSSWDLGPDMTGNLHGILMRFREGIVAAQGDVKKMYYNVRVTKEDEMMQLFIWKFTGEDKIRTFAMTRLIMGNKPSANCAQIALKETAALKNNAEDYPDAKIALSEDTYVDNTLTTADNVESIKRKITETEQVARQGGFFYKPWVISGQNLAETQALTGSTAENLEEKALGIYWNVKEDTIFIKAGINSKNKDSLGITSFVDNPKLKLTLRICLSFHSRPYDPLGLILPVKMNGNLLFRRTLQQLSLKNKEMNKKPANRQPWDAEIVGETKQKWLDYFLMLEAAKEITFPRATIPKNVDKSIKPNIVSFDDGNEESYGAVVYSRYTLKDGKRECRLIAAKAKLGPLLEHGEVVKHELSGATTAVRIKTWVLQNSRIEFSSYLPLLDSRIVQDMIKKESYTLNTFAGLRVKEIASKSDVTSWMHINSKDNYVADILTRGATPDKLKTGSDWQTGPKWLCEDIENWPITKTTTSKEERDIIKSYERSSKSLKVRSSKQVSLDNIKHDFEELIERNSDLKRIINVVAQISRWKSPGKNAENLLNRAITAEEHDDALKMLIYLEQRKLNKAQFTGFNLVNK